MKNGTIKEEIVQAEQFELLEPLEVLEAYEETLVPVDDGVGKQVELIQVIEFLQVSYYNSSSSLPALRLNNIGLI